MTLEGRRVLYVSYNGMLDPLGQSQVLPYLRELGKRGIRFTILSYERAAAFEPEGIAKREELRRTLATENIDWHWLRYHQRPSLPATAYDLVRGVSRARKLARAGRIELVHARNQIPALIGLALKRSLGTKTIFDVRGLMANEYVDADHWVKGSVPYRLSKATETRALAGADGVVTLTKRIWPIINEWEGLRGRDVVHEVVPCCADLELFKFRAEDREQRRQELGLSGKLVLVYSGSLDGWYLTEKMAEFFVRFQTVRPDAHLLWLTQGSHERVRKLMESKSVSQSAYTVIKAASREVPSYLSASDAGLAFIKPAFSKQASSPTKYAEYLGCGLPLVINAGVGDSDALVNTENVGTLVTDFTDIEYERAAHALVSLISDQERIRGRTREVAERLFDVRGVGVETYARLYERVLAN